MSNDLMKRKPTEVKPQADDAATRFKRELMADALDRVLGQDEPTAAPGPGEAPRVILVSANDAPATLDRAKELQREMFNAAAGPLEMKFAYYGADDAGGRRTCRITTRWISDADDMGNIMGRANCSCGCYVSIRRVLNAAVEENKVRPVQAVVIIGDAFHDDPEDLHEAALYANRLRRDGTKVFFVQQGDGTNTARKLRWLAGVSGGAYFRFDPRTQERQLTEMMAAVSTYAAGGEEAVRNVLFGRKPMPLHRYLAAYALLRPPRLRTVSRSSL
jgi:hypothetical protein